MDGVTVKSLADPTFLNNEIANGLVPALVAALQLRVRVRVLARVPFRCSQAPALRLSTEPALARRRTAECARACTCDGIVGRRGLARSRHHLSGNQA